MQFGVISNYKFFKDYKVHLPHSSCNFVVLKNLLERINTKLHSKSCYYLYSLTTIFQSVHIFSELSGQNLVWIDNSRRKYR